MDICKTCLGCNLLEDKNFKGKDRCEYYVYSYNMAFTTFNNSNTTSNKPDIIGIRLDPPNR